MTTTALEIATYGVDTYCMDGLVPGRMARGRAVVAQNAYHRLITSRGELVGGDDEGDFGLNLLETLGAVSTASERAALPGRIRAELMKDPRIEDVEAVVTPLDAGRGVVSHTIEIHAVTGEGPFDIVLSVDDLTVALVGLRTDQ
jgi:hypothetical protein